MLYVNVTGKAQAAKDVRFKAASPPAPMPAEFSIAKLDSRQIHRGHNSVILLQVLTNVPQGIMMPSRASRNIAMEPKYNKGQRVIITPVKNQQLSPRDSDLEPYAGQIGEVVDYHWISPSTASIVFYIYTVRIGNGHQKVVLHEDELEAYLY